MKKLAIIIAISWVLAFLALPALAEPPTPPTVVEGTGVPLTDWWAVQSAVNAGGEVLLKGTFDFGVFPPYSVQINNDVKIFGETDNKGDPLTKITGGVFTFSNIPPLPVPPPPAQIPQGPKIEIRNIHFDGSLYTPLWFAYTSGAVISGNKITNVVPTSVPSPDPKFPPYMHVGALFYTENLLPGAMTGLLVFENNQVDMDTGSFDPEETLAEGVMFFNTWGATIEIKENTFTNVSRNSIECLENYIDLDGIGSVVITNNNVIVPTEGPDWPTPDRPNGILAGWFFDPSGAYDPAKYSEILIEHNHIEMQGDISKLYGEAGIILLCDEGIISKNHIVTGGAGGAVGIFSSSSHGLISNNRINGIGYCAMWATPAFWNANPYGGDNNTFNGNNIDNFNPYAWGYDVILGGNNNVVNGGSGTVWNLGTDNVINGEFVIIIP